MSGGFFDYSQWQIGAISEEIGSIIRNNGKVEFDEYGDNIHQNLPTEIINHFKDAEKILAKAYIYAQRIDYLLAGDDGEESFLSRLKIDLEASDFKHDHIDTNLNEQHIDNSYELNRFLWEVCRLLGRVKDGDGRIEVDVPETLDEVLDILKLAIDKGIK